MKKNGKLITLALFTFLIGSVPAFAREMTLSELGEEASKIQKDAGYVYIIGDYAFTSKFNIKTEDIMLASTTLKVQNPTDSKKMVINQITRTYNDIYEPTGWAKGTNALGTAGLPEKFNISYIDYVIIPDKSKAEINIDLSDSKFSKYNEVLKDKLKFDATQAYENGKLEFKDGKVSGLLLQDTKITLSTSDKEKYNNPKYFFAYVLEVPNASSKTKITTSGMNRKGELKWEKFDIQDEKGKTSGIVVLVPVDPTEWEKDKTLTITVDVDGEGKYYEPVDYKLDLSGLKFQQDSTATLADTTYGVSQADLETIKSWGYTFPTNKEYELEKDSKNVNNYKLTGKIEQQHLKANGWSKEEQNGYFFLFTLKKPDELKSVPEGVKVTVIGKETKTFGKEYFNEEGIFADLFKLDPECASDCKIIIKVDWDGEDGNEYLESKEITISYNNKDLVFEKPSNFTVESITSAGETELKKSYSWKKTNGYSVNFDTTTTPAKVTGFLPIFSDNSELPFKDDHLTKYYIGFEIKTNTIAGNNVEVKIIDGKETILWKKDNFDTDDTIYMLKHLHLENEDKKFEIVVDMDGNGEEYAPYTITFDWSELELQTYSSGANFDLLDTTKLDGTSPEKKELNGYNFNSETVNGVTLTNEDEGIAGTIKEQTLVNAFENNTGYFVPIKISVPKDEPWFAKHQNDWTIILNTEKGDKKTYIPTTKEHEQGWVMVLFRLDDKKSDKKIKYEIDFDGVGDAFLPYEYTIDYSKLSFEEAHKLTFKGLETVLTIYDGDTITKDMLPEDTPEGSDSYHDFAYWANEEGTNIVGTKITSDTEDTIALEPHWYLYSDKFVADVLEDLNKTKDFSSEFKIEDYVENSGKITITVIDPTTKLSRMNDTSIPGAIAYILSKDEINEITLLVNGEEKTFTKNGIEDQAQLKKAIQDGAKELYSKILKENFDGKTDEDVTLSDLANKEGYESFTLKFNPEKVSKTVTLVKAPVQQGISLASNIEVPTDYKFTFESDVVIVKNQQSLEDALKGSVTHIFIGDNFEVNKTIDIERKVEIDGGSSSYTITAGSGVNTIFAVKSKDVTIKNIELKDSQKQAIVVETGSLTTTGVKITHSASIPESFEAGIEVKDGASLTASNMTFDNEHYNIPLVKAEKNSAKVTLTDKESKTALKTKKEKITKYNDQTEEQKITSYGDIKEVDNAYNYYNYYNNSNNSRIYETNFRNYEGRKILSFISYNYYEESVSLPPEDTFGAFYKLNYDGNVYELLGFTESSNKTVYNGSGDYSTLPEGVVKKDELKATDDKTYYAAYKVSLPKNVTKVTTATALKAALENPEITEIYIDTTSEIDMTSVMPVINLSRSVSIIGEPEISKIKVGKINISADNVFLSRLNLEFTQGSSNSALIDITGDAQDVSMWQCVINNSGDAVDYAVKYNGDSNSIVDIRWTTFNNSDNKFNKGYIYVANELATGSNISYNTFRQLSSEGSKKTAVIINKFSYENILQEDDNIKINSNTFNENDYAIKFEKDASGTKANISLATNSNINIAVEYSDDKKDFSSISLDTDLSKVKVTYIDKDGKTYEETPESVTGPTFKGQIEMVPSSVPESATISGLIKNGNTYSGLISQSVDGKFYLPLTLTSSKFDDRVSTVTVTDPNGNSEEYLYSSRSNNGIATVSSANTMKLNLEAIKSSKISSEAGKVYNIAIDYNGDKKTDNTYTIDYSGVETLEEKINLAAQNTLNSKSFTVTKDNHINGYTEAFIYKFNSESGLTHLISTKDNVEQYTFSLKYIGKENSKVSVVTEKQTVHKEQKVYINDWEYLHPIQVGRAIQEVTMLTDVMGETYINAIDKVKSVEGKAHTYIVTLNRDKYNDWVKKNYLSNSKYSSAEWALNDTVEVEVELDDDEQYIKSIKTSQKSSDNTFSITFENINSTDIKEPKEFLAENDKVLTDEDIIDFYNEGIKWWEKHTGATVYSE